jgi:hypothetical protein
MGLSFTISAGPASEVILRCESRQSHDHILLSHIRDSPKLEGQVPVFISPRNRMAEIYPPSLGVLFVTSYDSQGYGGGIRPRLHTGFTSGQLEVKVTLRLVVFTANQFVLASSPQKLTIRNFFSS